MTDATTHGSRLAARLMLILAALAVGYHLWLVTAGLIPNLVSRPLHILAVLPFIFWFVAEPARGWRRLVDGALLVVGVGACGYILVSHEALDEQYGRLQGPLQFAVAWALVGLALEMARRQVKWAMPATAMIALAYGLFGQHLPGELGHAGIPLASFLGTLTITEGGLWGTLTGASAEVVAVFVILGAVIGAGEGGRGFMAAAVAIAGRLRAGAAKVSVLSSALFGSISGSASANVASTGAITLPTMKRLGYPPALAAAVEAVASSGGQIMPPVMGAGAFIMVELLRTSYTAVLMAALPPALLFFWGVWVGCDLYGRRYHLEPMRADEIPPFARVARLVLFFALPFGVLLGILFLTGRTPQFAGAVATAISAALLLFDESFRPGLARWGRRLADAAVTAARQIATIASIIFCAGLIIGVLNLTGLGVKITSLILGLSGGNLWGALVLTGLACLILGMEVPTTAAYVICVAVAGPALTELGLEPLYAHLFIFWFALLSTITPPVCGTVFIAAGMAGAPWLTVALHAMTLGIGLYLVPLAFVANPSMLMLQSTPGLALLATAKVALGVLLVSRGLIWRDGPALRAGSLVAGAALIFVAGV
ncbi:MAG: TRAP transporter fused permease subunit [Rhodocyclaceae bacterium]|nr:TRAP transporter fused permease subunit [Rhodocyclaceae bacterium]